MIREVVSVRSFEDLDTLVGLVPFDVVRALGAIDHGRGSEALYKDKLPALLIALADRARVASIEASSAIEGVVVENQIRAAEIIAGKAAVLRNRSEQELAGYRAALDYLYRKEWQPLNVGLVLYLHRLLFSYTDLVGGQLKISDNLVVDKMPDGTSVRRFTPVAAAQTPYFIEELVGRYLHAKAAQRHHPLILVGLFALDFLTIHPFQDGNGRVIRALTNALLQDAGYDVTRYVSLEDAIAESADGYYATLLASTLRWHESEHDPWPWLRYFVGLVSEAYEDFAMLTDAARSTGTKQDRVRDYVLNHAPSPFRIADIRTALPGISDQTIRLALDSLKRAGKVGSDSVGRGATWTKTPGPVGGS